MGIRATGNTAAELYEALGLGLFHLMTDLRRVRPTDERSVSARSSDPEGLAVDFLSKLLLLQQLEGFLVREITVRAIGRPTTSLVAQLRGEPFDPARHSRRIEVKAVTMHRLRFDPSKGQASVIVDI